MLRDTMQVCMNGHKITDMFNGNMGARKAHCDECGAKTIFTCQKCQAPIPGYNYDSGVISIPKVPKHCHGCGNPYPWTKRSTEIKKEGKKESKSSTNGKIQKSIQHGLDKLFLDKLNRILANEEKFFEKYPYIRPPIIILTSSIYIIFYLTILMLLLRTFSWIITSLGFSYSAIISLILAILVLLMITILYIKHNSGGKQK